MNSEISNNMRVVRAFLELAFNARQPVQAVTAYLAASYRQHTPLGQDGSQAFVRLATDYLEVFPGLQLTVQLVVADGPFVVVQSLMQRHPRDRGRQVLDTFQLANGRIVEHWDVLQEPPEVAALATAIV